MKLSAPYFGNRFATLAKKKAIPARKSASISEMEALEPRILLSGITGTSKKSVTFFDADGDKVTVSLQGAGSFNVDLGGSKNSDAANITIYGDKSGVAGSLGVSVAPVGSFTAPVQTKTIYNPSSFAAFSGTVGNLGNEGISQKVATQFYDLTPGFTNIGSITAAAGVKQVGSIGLNAAIVPVIDLGNAAAGNINLSTGMVAKVDQLMATNSGLQPDRPAWSANLGKIDLFDISAGSIAGINIASASTENDFNGDIEATTGGIGRITGSNADFNGTISILGTQSGLGNIQVNSFSSNAVISTFGDLTFDAAGYAGLLNVKGHLNLGLNGNSPFTGTIVADGGISGLNSSTTDTILISGVSMEGQLTTAGDIASITLNNADLKGALDAKNIGTIYFGANSKFDGSSILASESLGGLVTRNAGLNLGAALIDVGDTIGLIDVAGGDLTGTIFAANLGEVIVRGGNMDAEILASSSIGDITVIDGSLTGSLTAQGTAGIGAISALSLDNGTADGGAIIGANIYSAGGIKSITATTTDVNSPAIGTTTIQALGTTGAITATNYGANGEAINGLTLNAGSISGVTANSEAGIAINGTNTFTSTVGSIANITAKGYSGGILGTTTLNSATKVESISGTAQNSGDGISGLIINAQTGISAVAGKAMNGNGIGGSGKFTSLTGDISGISGISTALAGVATGRGIDGLTVEAVAGSITDITGTTTGWSVDNHGIHNVTLKAQTGIGTITGTANAGHGINGGTFTTQGGNIAAIVAQTNTGTAISGAKFTAAGGAISAITATPNGIGGNAINNSSFIAQTLPDISVTVSHVDGGYGINDSIFRATAGDIGKITVVNKSLGANSSAYGIGGNTTHFEATGNIGDISVTVAANKNLTAGKETYAAIQGDMRFTADSDLNGTGDFGSVNVTTTGGSKIEGISRGPAGSLATFKGHNMGDFAVTMKSTGAGGAVAGVNNADPLIQLTGNMGKLTIDNSGGGGLNGSLISVTGTMGEINIMTPAGGHMLFSVIRATSIDSVDFINRLDTIDTTNTFIANGGFDVSKSIGDVNIKGLLMNVGVNAGTTIGNVIIGGIISFGGIESGRAAGATDGSITSVTSYGAGQFTKVTAKVGNIGPVIVNGNLTSDSVITATTGNIESISVTGAMSAPITAAGNIGPITVGGNITSTITATAGNIGAISGQGTGNQSLTLVTAPSTGTIGALSFSSGNLANGSTVSVGITNAVAVGAIEVTSTAGTANLTLTGGAALTTVGALNVDGVLNVTGPTLNKVTSLASLSAGSLTATGTQVVIGDSAAVGTSVGAIAIGTDLASISSGVTLNNSQYRFNFDSYTATPNGVVAGSNMTAVAEGSWVYQTPASGNSALGGISFILA